MPMAWLTRRRRPAVSTNRQMSPSSSTSESTGSIVVPATASTTERDSPVSLFSSDDLPTFGLPTSATRRGPAAAPNKSAGASGSASRTASSRSPDPRPCSADTGYGSPSPSDHSCAASASARSSSTLLAARSHRALRPAQHAGHRLVGDGGADRGVDHDQHRVGGHHRPLRLRGDRRLQPLGAGLPAAGVDHGESSAAPQRVVGDPVPGDARDVLHDRLAAPDDPIHQRRLADVRPADDGERRHRRRRPRRRPRARRDRPPSRRTRLSSVQVPSRSRPGRPRRPWRRSPRPRRFGVDRG